jgi:hypothetical protein
MDKEKWLDCAEVIDSLRIFPRFLVSWYMVILTWSVCYQTWWYAHLAGTDRTVEVTAFYGMEMGGIFGLAVYIFKIYTDGGRDWSQRYASTTRPNPG